MKELYDVIKRVIELVEANKDYDPRASWDQNYMKVILYSAIEDALLETVHDLGATFLIYTMLKESWDQVRVMKGIV